MCVLSSPQLVCMSSQALTPPTHGERLREARDAANLTQAELAERFGCSERALQNWEAGAKPRPRYRRLIAEFIVSVEEAAAA